MPDIPKIKSNLESRLAELTKRAADIDETLDQPADHDWEESATEAEDDEVMEKVGSMAVDEIVKIKSALTKIAAGTYGACAKCQGPIGKKRLEALPFAIHCVECADSK